MWLIPRRPGRQPGGRLHRGGRTIQARRRPRSVAIGFFDGVRRRHREVIRGCETVVTFRPPPARGPPPVRGPMHPLGPQREDSADRVGRCPARSSCCRLAPSEPPGRVRIRLGRTGARPVRHRSLRRREFPVRCGRHRSTLRRRPLRRPDRAARASRGRRRSSTGCATSWHRAPSRANDVLGDQLAHPHVFVSAGHSPSTTAWLFIGQGSSSARSPGPAGSSDLGSTS